jgi:hypothetical protein
MAQQSMSLKVLIFPISLVVAVAVAIFFIKPAFSEMMSVKSSLAEKENQLENLKNQNQKLQNLKSKWESLAEEKNLVATALPEAENVDSYVSELTSKASRSGILLSGIQASQKGGSVSAETAPSYICGAGPRRISSQRFSASSSSGRRCAAGWRAGFRRYRWSGRVKRLSQRSWDIIDGDGQLGTDIGFFQIFGRYEQNVQHRFNFIVGGNPGPGPGIFGSLDGEYISHSLFQSEEPGRQRDTRGQFGEPGKFQPEGYRKIERSHLLAI